ncbi:hypothetical protein K431DRAFT_162105 [Polychaeton citri CBS 116435]|uniref:Uncharacterized protein n=1 Tax=Polychaeton citri CBS 116435 TaxID=1314669 RepID=A0A9P4UIR3_9PEZI|nr:hypothetical protein K431DRAFT_162105 [Polychaeton citri CBS 116435]
MVLNLRYFHQRRPASTFFPPQHQPPPSPPKYKPTSEHPPPSRPTASRGEVSEAQLQVIIEKTKLEPPPEPNPARGADAARRYVREGRLDPRYRPAAIRVTALICALPVLIVSSYFLWQRAILGVERKKMPPPRKTVQERMVEEG